MQIERLVGILSTIKSSSMKNGIVTNLWHEHCENVRTGWRGRWQVGNVYDILEKSVLTSSARDYLLQNCKQIASNKTVSITSHLLHHHELSQGRPQ